MTSRRRFLLQRISFPGRPIFIQLPPADLCGGVGAGHDAVGAQVDTLALLGLHHGAEGDEGTRRNHGTLKALTEPSTEVEVFLDKRVRETRQTAGGELASRRNKKARDFTDPFIYKSTLLSTG